MSRITLVENEKVISQDIQISKTFNDYFISIPVTNIEQEYLDSEENDHTFMIIVKHQNQPSIKLIIARNKNKSLTLRFRETNIDEIKMYIQNLDPKKAF